MAFDVFFNNETNGFDHLIHLVPERKNVFKAAW